MRIYILDSGLRGEGHHWHFASHAVPELRAAGHDVRVYGHQEMPDEFRKLGAQPLFQFSLYQIQSKDPYFGTLHDFNTGAKLFAADLASLGQAAPRTGDLVLLPTATGRDILGLATWAQAAGVKPRVAMLFHFLRPHSLQLSEGSLGGALYRQAALALNKVAPKSCLIGATNERLAEQLTGPFGREVVVLPLPHWYAPGPRPLPDATHARPVVAFLGTMRINKGHGMIPALVREMKARGAQADVVIHIASVVDRLATDLREYEALESEGLATLVQRWLSEAELEALIASATLVVQPYAQTYSRVISGVFAFSAAAGRPSIVPAGTWMAEQITRGKAAGVVFDPPTVERATDAIMEGLASREALLARGGTLAPIWQRDNGSLLIERVLEWATRA